MRPQNVLLSLLLIVIALCLFACGEDSASASPGLSATSVPQSTLPPTPAPTATLQPPTPSPVAARIPPTPSAIPSPASETSGQAVYDKTVAARATVKSFKLVNMRPDGAYTSQTVIFPDRVLNIVRDATNKRTTMKDGSISPDQIFIGTTEYSSVDGVTWQEKKGVQNPGAAFQKDPTPLPAGTILTIQPDQTLGSKTVGVLLADMSQSADPQESKYHFKVTYYYDKQTYLLAEVNVTATVDPKQPAQTLYTQWYSNYNSPDLQIDAPQTNITVVPGPSA